MNLNRRMRLNFIWFESCPWIRDSSMWCNWTDRQAAYSVVLVEEKARLVFRCDERYTGRLVRNKRRDESRGIVPKFFFFILFFEKILLLSSPFKVSECVCACVCFVPCRRAFEAAAAVTAVAASRVYLHTLYTRRVPNDGVAMTMMMISIGKAYLRFSDKESASRISAHTDETFFVSTKNKLCAKTDGCWNRWRDANDVARTRAAETARENGSEIESEMKSVQLIADMCAVGVFSLSINFGIPFPGVSHSLWALVFASFDLLFLSNS